MEGRLSRELLLHGDDLTSVELGFNFGRRAVAQRGMDAHVIEPIDPAQGGEFKIISTFPGSFPVDEAGLVEGVAGHGEAGGVGKPRRAVLALWRICGEVNGMAGAGSAGPACKDREG